MTLMSTSRVQAQRQEQEPEPEMNCESRLCDHGSGFESLADSLTQDLSHQVERESCASTRPLQPVAPAQPAPCVSCGERKAKSQYSKSQLRRPAAARRCATCVAGVTVAPAQKAEAAKRATEAAGSSDDDL